jgi:hypothetical protein
MSNQELAAAIARKIFEAGDMPHDKTQRIQFKGGEWPDNETSLGGFNERALADCILGVLEQRRREAGVPK